jgi:hypothetical protein
MTLTKKSMQELTQEEWNELVALKNAINTNPASVHYDKMEKGEGDNYQTVHRGRQTDPFAV